MLSTRRPPRREATTRRPAAGCLEGASGRSRPATATRSLPARWRWRWPRRLRRVRAFGNGVVRGYYAARREERLEGKSTICLAYSTVLSSVYSSGDLPLCHPPSSCLLGANCHTTSPPTFHRSHGVHSPHRRLGRLQILLCAPRIDGRGISKKS